MLTNCIAEAILQADLRPEQIKCVACGLSGIDTRDDARGRIHLLRDFLKQLDVPDHVRPAAIDHGVWVYCAHESNKAAQNCA